MDTRREMREFLASRRARLTPQQAGVRVAGRARRVPGLRREEVAALAGVSMDYYTRLERGGLAGASDSVLEGIVRALQLDDVERAHLYDLARAARAQAPRRPSTQRVRPSVQQLLDSMTGTAAFLRNGRLDVLATNPLGRALYSPMFDAATARANLARFVYLDPGSRDFYRDWDGIALDAVGSLRAQAGRHPGDRDLAALIAELSERSEEFRSRWADHDVRYYRSGVQPFSHPVTGDLELAYDVLELPADPGQTIVAYTAAPGSPSADKLALLANSSAPVPPTAAAAGED